MEMRPPLRDHEIRAETVSLTVGTMRVERPAVHKTLLIKFS